MSEPSDGIKEGRGIRPYTRIEAFPYNELDSEYHVINRPIILGMSPSAARILLLFERLIEPARYTIKYTPSCPSDSHTLTRGYKELHALHILQRVGKGKYILNPACVYAPPSTVQHLNYLWETHHEK